MTAKIGVFLAFFPFPSFLNLFFFLLALFKQFLLTEAVFGQTA